MKKSVVFIVLGVILLVGVIVGVGSYFVNGRSYELKLAQLENLKSISLNQNGKESIISDNKKMEDILNILGGKRTTKEESVQDSPVNIDNEIKVDFNFIEKGTSTLFIYKRDDNYYIEQPYNGIYQISEDEYNSVEEYIR